MGWFLVSNETLYRISEMDALNIHRSYPDSVIIREDKLEEYFTTRRTQLIYG